MSIREWAFLAASVLIGLSAILWIWSAWRYSQYSVTQARVTSVEVEFDSDGDKRFYAVYAFKDKTGFEFKGRSTARANFSPYLDGQTITVLYHPEHPEQATINSFREKYAWSLTLFVIGIVFAIVGLVAR